MTREHSQHPSAFEIYWTKRRMWIAVTWSVMLIALAAGYYFVIFLPQQERAQMDLSKSQQETQSRIEQAKIDLQKAQQDAVVRAKADDLMRLQSCLQNVEHSYAALWDQTCADRGMGKNCLLPNDVSASLNQYFSEEKALCVKEYPQA